jgi:hypothetical protein
MQLTPDWMITKKTSSGGSAYRQGIFFVSDAGHLLPRALVNYAGKNGLIVTEIVEGAGIAHAPEGGGTLPELPDIRGASPLDTADNLLALLGYPSARDADVNIFETARDGFTLAIKAGLLVKNGDRRVLFHAKKLPQQFVDILREGKTDVTILADDETGKAIIEKTLRALNVPFSSDTFSLSLPGKPDKTPITLSIPALKVEGERGSLYLVDFALDRDIQQLLQVRWEARIARY